MAQKPSIPKGTRDFLPEVMVRRNYIFDTIKSVFKRYGFLPIETPSMENLSTLLGKYGDEGDKLLFRVLNSGDTSIPENIDEIIELIKKHINEVSIDLTNKILDDGIVQTECDNGEIKVIVDKDFKSNIKRYTKKYLSDIISK